MKTVKLKDIPTCQVCLDHPAEFDAPLAMHGGQWGYVCHTCATIEGANKDIGFHLEQKQPSTHENDKSPPAMGREPTSSSYWIGVLNSSTRDIECPQCGEGRTVEPDAAYTFTCENCGQKVTCPSPPM